MELTAPPALTVLILEDDPEGEAVLDIAEEWYAQRVLTDVAVVTPGWVTTTGPGPATVSTHLLGGDQPNDLMTYLGSRPLGLVRLIVLNVLTHQEKNSDRLVSACDEVATLIRRAMPLAVDDKGLTTGVRLVRVNLMVPESSVALQQRSLIQPGWEVNAVVSPEDRPDLDRMNVFVRSGVNLAGHALTAAATIGGLWVGMGKAAFDDIEVDSTYGGLEVHVVRCQAKMIVGDDRVELLAGDAISRITRTPDGAVHFIRWGYETDRPDQWVTSTLGRLVELPEWKAEQRRSAPLSRAEIPLGTLIRDWFRFQAALPLVALGLLGAKARDTLERSVTGALVGGDAGVVGRIYPVTPDLAGKAAEIRLGELALSLEPLRLEEHAASWGQTTPTAWRRIRDLAIGLVDGSDLPDPFNRQSKAELVEVLAPSRVVAPQRPTRSEQSLEEPQQSGASAEAPQLEQPSQTDTPSTEPAYGVSGLLDRLAEHVQSSEDHEAKAAQAASEDIERYGSAPPTKSLQRARTLCLVAWIAALVVLVIVGVRLWLSIRNGHAFADTEVWSRALSGLILGAAIFLIGGHLYYRALRQYEWQVRQRMHALRVATDEYVSARQQQKRWAVMGHGLSDWIRILRQLLHAPLSTRQNPARAAVLEFRGLPAAVAVAVARERVNDTGADLGRSAAEALCTRGWLREEFARLVAASPSNNREAGVVVSGDLPADLDLGLRQHGPRSELVDVAIGERVKRAATDAAVHKVHEMVIEGRVQVPDLTVTRTGPYSSGLVEDNVSFLSSSVMLRASFAGEIFSDQALVEGLQMPELTVFSLPPGVHGRAGADTRIERSGLSLMTRVDVSKTLRLEDLTLFVRRASQSPVAEPSGADDFN
ncbi:hypothetical protein ISU07_17870 [Nocardioides islandensis]|uniref:Uncharacterized protein n=1 Tax=Nocardioides islandensis TaxID=433663 RepID=A0A930VEG1_9ACTN|nr:hypothetical protein [Nocardioides islandensis]MBF4765003.1 hypothetical protein [Nocardioides islandensis]